jgi:rhomboid family GlyGly-CTERM serine protease
MKTIMKNFAKPKTMLLRVPYATSVFVLVCLALGDSPQASLLAFDREAIFAGEVWRLWSGHLVHFSMQQLFLDVSALLLVGAVAETAFGPRFVAWALFFGMPAISLGLLLLAPDLAYYRGASGLVMLLAFVAGAAFWSRQPRLRVILAILGLGLFVKAVLDAAGFVSDMSGLPEGVRVAWQAHVLGAGMGWASARLKLKNLQ